jgi:hypothetical protein
MIDLNARHFGAEIRKGQRSCRRTRASTPLLPSVHSESLCRLRMRTVRQPSGQRLRSKCSLAEEAHRLIVQKLQRPAHSVSVTRYRRWTLWRNTACQSLTVLAPPGRGRPAALSARVPTGLWLTVHHPAACHTNLGPRGHLTPVARPRQPSAPPHIVHSLLTDVQLPWPEPEPEPWHRQHGPLVGAWGLGDFQTPRRTELIQQQQALQTTLVTTAPTPTQQKPNECQIGLPSSRCCGGGHRQARHDMQ